MTEESSLSGRVQRYARVGAAAHAAGLELQQLASQGTDLEDVFFHLVETAQHQDQRQDQHQDQQQDQQQEVVA